MSNTLNSKQVIGIAVAAMVGLVIGYVVITNLSREGEPTVPETKVGALTTTSAKPATSTPNGPVVPDVLGQRLPAAEDALKQRGFTKVQTRDASPENRVILEKDNWIVEAQTPAGGSSTPLDTVVVLHVRKNTDAAQPSPAPEGVMPGVVCAELQAAQDALRKSGYFLITYKDGTGQGRMPLVDRNWVVIGQSEAPGTKPSATTKVELTVVKHGEDTGATGCLT